MCTSWASRRIPWDDTLRCGCLVVVKSLIRSDLPTRLHINSIQISNRPTSFCSCDQSSRLILAVRFYVSLLFTLKRIAFASVLCESLSGSFLQKTPRRFLFLSSNKNSLFHSKHFAFDGLASFSFHIHTFIFFSIFKGKREREREVVKARNRPEELRSS